MIGSSHILTSTRRVPRFFFFPLQFLQGQPLATKVWSLRAMIISAKSFGEGWKVQNNWTHYMPKKVEFNRSQNGRLPNKFLLFSGSSWLSLKSIKYCKFHEHTWKYNPTVRNGCLFPYPIFLLMTGIFYGAVPHGGFVTSSWVSDGEQLSARATWLATKLGLHTWSKLRKTPAKPKITINIKKPSEETSPKLWTGLSMLVQRLKTPLNKNQEYDESVHFKILQMTQMTRNHVQQNKPDTLGI